MKPKQVIDQLQITKKSYKLKISTIKETYSNKDIPDIFKNDIRQYEQKIKAIDHAINCVGAIEQIKWERDIAIQQLNELGYQFGEKIGSDEE